LLLLLPPPLFDRMTAAPSIRAAPTGGAAKLSRVRQDARRPKRALCRRAGGLQSRSGRVSNAPRISDAAFVSGKGDAGPDLISSPGKAPRRNLATKI
jgi:hypothetical protein